MQSPNNPPPNVNSIEKIIKTLPETIQNKFADLKERINSKTKQNQAGSEQKSSEIDSAKLKVEAVLYEKFLNLISIYMTSCAGSDVSNEKATLAMQTFVNSWNSDFMNVAKATPYDYSPSAKEKELYTNIGKIYIYQRLKGEEKSFKFDVDTFAEQIKKIIEIPEIKIDWFDIDPWRAVLTAPMKYSDEKEEFLVRKVETAFFRAGLDIKDYGFGVHQLQLEFLKKICKKYNSEGAVTKENLEKTLRKAANDGNKGDILLILSLPGELKVDINAQGKESGRTALHWAVIAGKTECAICLLAHGASFDICDKKRNNACHYAIMSTSLQMKFHFTTQVVPKFLKENGSPVFHK